MTTAIHTAGLTRRYGAREAVKPCSVTVPRGSVTGLVGPNGAGKTTLLAMLLGLVRPTGGTATILGHSIEDPAAYLTRVGALIEHPGFHPRLSARGNLAYLCRLRGIDPGTAAEVLEQVGLAERGEDQFRAYSMGMRQRLAIAAALLNDPELVLLDEPTNGVDPEGIRGIRALIRAIAAHGRTVVVSSHLLSELEQVCTWLIVLDHGGVSYAGPLDGLPRTLDPVLRILPADAGDLTTLTRLAAGLGLEPVEEWGPGLTVRVPGGDTARAAAALNGSAHVAGIRLTHLEHPHDDLENRYLALIGGPQR